VYGVQYKTAVNNSETGMGVILDCVRLEDQVMLTTEEIAADGF
jgi:hypothetical protein